MIRLLAILLLCVSPSVNAVECGPLMRALTIKQMQDAIVGADARLEKHSSTLLEESKRVLAAGPSSFDASQADRLHHEMNIVSEVRLTGERLLSVLTTAWLLATIRDAMLNSRDKGTVSAYLSLQLVGGKRVAEMANNRASSLLTSITMPGVAVDVAKMRDALEMVNKDLSKCTEPRPQSTMR